MGTVSLKIVIRPPGRPAYTITLERLTEVVIAARRLNMGIFEEKMKRAREVAARIEEHAIADFDKVIARGEEVHRKREQATTAHLVKLDSLHASLDHFEKSIEEYANGPPLDAGAPSNKAWEPPFKP